MLKVLDGLSLLHSLTVDRPPTPDLRMVLTGLWHAYLWLESMNILNFNSKWVKLRVMTIKTLI
jgi:hypothetical protein